MSDTRIKDGTGTGTLALVTEQNRLSTQSITIPVPSEQSRLGQLYGCGTGSITPTSSFSLGPVLWLRNDDPDNLMYIEKLIFGWNGGSTTWLKTCLSFIKYQTSVPTGANTSAPPAIENISRSGTTEAVTDALATCYKWDGTGTGMTGSSGGFLQIPNRVAQGDTEKGIDGQIILGQNDTMAILVTPEETGLFHASIVYSKAPANGFGR